MSNIVLISYTPLDASGGVPRWNRDFVRGFPGTKHFSWSDLAKMYTPDAAIHYTMEWKRAELLNNWLRVTGEIKREDIILVDGFWGLGLETFPNVVSVSHGNWSHTTKDDVEKGIPPEFPEHHAAQLEYRKKHLARGGRMVAVSEFIANQCKVQWKMNMPVINNAIDLEKFKPASEKLPRARQLVIHGTTTTNKGFDHIERCRELDADVLLLDEAERKLGLSKYETLAQADMVIHPSAHEGNSYFVLETLACGVPLVSYNVGLMYQAYRTGMGPRIGVLMDRNERDTKNTMLNARWLLSMLKLKPNGLDPRFFAEQHGLDRFWSEWRKYLTKEFPNASLPS